MAGSDLPFWKYAIVLVVASVFSVFMHELGHLAIASILGVQNAGMGIGLLTPSYVILSAEVPARYLMISLSGIAVNALLAVIAEILRRKEIWTDLLIPQTLLRVNIFLLAFNLLPVPGLDGWHMIKASLALFL